MELAAILQAIEDVRARFTREEEQAILQRNMDRAVMALAGKDACERMAQEIRARAGWRPEPLRAATRGK